MEQHTVLHGRLGDLPQHLVQALEDRDGVLHPEIPGLVEMLHPGLEGTELLVVDDRRLDELRPAAQQDGHGIQVGVELEHRRV